MLDVGLPDGDGIALAGELLQQRHDLRVLILTGDLGSDTVARALAVGAHGYVHKQHNADELFACAQYVTQRRSLRE